MRQAKEVLLQKARALPGRNIRAIAFAGEQHVVQLFSILLALSIAAYLYFVGVSIMNVISNREASVESDRLRSVVAGLEEQYFMVTKTISPTAAGALGLTGSSGTTFVRPAGAVATHATQHGTDRLQ